MRPAASASASRQDEANKITPTLGLLFSDTFADDTLGVLVNGIYTKRDTYTNHVFVSGWEGGYLHPCQLTPICTDAQLGDSAARNIVSWYQQQFGAEQGQTADERIDGRIALQWRPSDQLLLTVDDNYSRQYVKTVTYAFGAWFDFTTFGPNCDQARALDPTLIGSHVLVRTRQENSDTLKQTRFVVSWNDENVKLDLGASYLDDTFELRSFNTFANNLWQAWAGYGPPSGRSSGVVLPASLQQGTISTANFIPGFSGAQALMPKLLVYSPPALYSYLEGLGNPQTHHIDGFNYGCCDYTGSLDLALDPGSIQKIQEKTWAAFFHGHFDAKVAQMPLHFDAGIRREHTGIVSGGFGRLPVLLTKNPADPTLLSTTYSNPQPISTSSDYAYLLPSLDMKLELTPRIHFRLDASRTLTRPAINYLTPVLNVGALPRVGALNANGGNPTLKPYLSDNLDFALEWYYQPNSYVAVDYFVKNVSNFIVQGTSRQTINNVIDPTTGQPAVYTVAQRVMDRTRWSMASSSRGSTCSGTVASASMPMSRWWIPTSRTTVRTLPRVALPSPVWPIPRISWASTTSMVSSCASRPTGAINTCVSSVKRRICRRSAPSPPSSTRACRSMSAPVIN
jgi:outer membrane receptor protein involved in Fe transport